MRQYNPMIEKVRAAIIKHSMLEAGGSVAVGVSGGADSVALLHIFLKLQDEFNLKITAAHLNHNLRGDESENDQAFVINLCRRLQVDLAVESADVAAIAKSRRLSLEEAGREARYSFFSRCGCDKIAVAHSLNDSVETMLLNFARGSALRGLSGIPPKRRNIIRPLIECERGEIENYCKANGLGFVTDSTNLSDDFARNKIRHHAIPAILSVNSGFWRHASGTLEALRLDADFLDALAEAKNTGSREGYLSLERPMRYRILSQMLSQREISVDGARLARLDEIVEAGGGAEQLREKYFFKADKLSFGISESSEADESTGYFCLSLEIPEKGETVEADVFSDKKLRLMNTDYEYYEENIKYVAKGLKNALDCDKIIGTLVLRQKLPADCIRLYCRNCTKTLRKLFQEAKLKPRQRERLFILADDMGPIWVEGFGAAERVAVLEKSARIMFLEVIGNKGWSYL